MTTWRNRTQRGRARVPTIAAFVTITMAAIVSTTMATTTTTAATRGGDGGEGQTEEGWMRAKRVNERPT